MAVIDTNSRVAEVTDALLNVSHFSVQRISLPLRADGFVRGGIRGGVNGTNPICLATPLAGC
jgi:hypothetical protein